jgi:hypothetical protein
LIAKGSSELVQLEHLLKELYGEGSKDGFVLRCNLKGLKLETA